MDKKVPFLKQHMAVRVLLYMLVTAFLMLSLRDMIMFRRDIDAFYVIPTAKEVIEHGFPREHIWNIDNTKGFVFQQWMYGIVMYYLDQCPAWAFGVFGIVQALVLMLMTDRLLQYRNLSFDQRLLCSFLGMCIDYTYIFAHRPETITLILLVAECLTLEQFMHTRKPIYLIGLPIQTLLEINCHASMWFFHYAVLLAYLCPSFYVSKIKKMSVKIDDTSLHYQWKTLLPFIVAMTGVLFINPYGVDAVLYLFRSLLSGTFSKISIMEMDTIGLLTPGVPVLGICAVVIYLIFWSKSGRLRSSDFNLMVGFLLLGLTAYRNVMFCYIPVIFVIAGFLQVTELTEKIDLQKDLYNYYYLIFVPVFLYLSFSLVPAFQSGKGYDNLLLKLYPTMYEVIEYLDEEQVPKDAHIFTSNNSGSFLEYYGYHNIYLDGRPEFTASIFTGGVDYPDDCFTYCVNGSQFTSATDELLHGKKTYIVTKEYMEQWIAENEFEYFIVDSTLVYLLGYFSGNDQYECIDLPSQAGASSTQNFYLYKKTA